MMQHTWPEYGVEAIRKENALWEEHHGEICDEVDGFTVIRCNPCEFIHVVPLPSKEDLKCYYERLFYQHSKPAYVQRYEQDRLWWEMTHRHTIQIASRYLTRLNHGWEPSVFDIGTGPGIFLDAARQSGWKTYGCEPSALLASQVSGRSHHVLAGTLEEVLDDGLLEGRQFDMVHGYEVLEHVPDPYQFLLAAHELLTPGGILSITVPNDYNPLQLACREEIGLNAYWLAPPEHLNYFTPLALSLLIERAKFRVMDIRGTFPMEQFMLSGGLVYVGDDKVGRKCHEERMQRELTAEAQGKWQQLEQHYRQEILEHRVGREMCIIAQRPVAEPTEEREVADVADREPA